MFYQDQLPNGGNFSQHSTHVGNTSKSPTTCSDTEWAPAMPRLSLLLFCVLAVASLNSAAHHNGGNDLAVKDIITKLQALEVQLFWEIWKKNCFPIQSANTDRVDPFKATQKCTKMCLNMQFGELWECRGSNWVWKSIKTYAVCRNKHGHMKAGSTVSLLPFLFLFFF